MGGKGYLGKSLSHCLKRGFRLPIPRRQSEIPIFNLQPAAVPLVGPGKYKGARAPRLENRADLPVQYLCLVLQPIAPAVQADLRHNERPVTRQILKPRQIRLEFFLVLEVNVKAQEVGK